MKTSRIALSILFASIAFACGTACAQVVTEFTFGISADASPTRITAGPDGNLWFTEANADRIGRITTLGVVTEFSAGITIGAQPHGITTGPDGNLWFVEFGIDRIGRIDPATGNVTEFSAGITPGATPGSITTGADGNLWFTEVAGGRIGRITPLGVVTEFSAGITAGAQPRGIAAGPDGNLWFAEWGIDRIGRINPTTGVITEFSAGITAGAAPRGITAGPDGNLWFTEQFGDRIGRITPLGVVTEFGANAGISPGSNPFHITAGLDGNLWFAENGDNQIGRITTGGDTPAGSNVAVDLGGGASAVGGVSIMFGQVTGAGDTVAGLSTSCSAAPAGFALGSPPVCYDVTTTASYTPPVEVCINYRNISLGQGPVALLHFQGGAWVDVTTTVDMINGIACGTVSSLSPFAVATQLPSGTTQTTATIASSLNPSTVGQAVTFTASVAGNFPTGTVQFIDGRDDLGSPVTLSGGGIAQLMTSTLKQGGHRIKAVYSGDASNTPSTSAVLHQQVKKPKGHAD